MNKNSLVILRKKTLKRFFNLVNSNKVRKGSINNIEDKIRSSHASNVKAIKQALKLMKEDSKISWKSITDKIKSLVVPVPVVPVVVEPTQEEIINTQVEELKNKLVITEKLIKPTWGITDGIVNKNNMDSYATWWHIRFFNQSVATYPNCSYTQVVSFFDEFGIEQRSPIRVTINSKIVGKNTKKAIEFNYQSSSDSLYIIEFLQAFPDVVSGGTMPYTLQWSNFGSGSVQNNLRPGNYSVKVIDANGCEKSVSVYIAESNFTFHPVVKNVSCNGGHDGYINLNISGGITPISVIWEDDPSAGGVRNNLNPGTYNLVLHDAAPCNIVESFVIREPQQIAITANITNAFDCNNLSSGAIDISVTGGKPPYTYSWSNNAITEDLINIPAGKYFIMVTDSNICSKSAQFEVIRQKPMELSVTSKTDYDCNTKGFLSKYTAHVSGGFSPFKFTWSNGKVSGVNNEFMETNQNNTVVLQATDSLGCSKTYDFTVDNTILNQTFGIDYMLVDCSKFIYQFNAIDADISGENYTYNWDFGDGKASTLKNVQHIYSTPGNYKIQLTISNGFCPTYFEKMVLVESLPKLSLDREPKICEGDSAVFHVTGALTYKWSDGNESDSIVLKEKGDYNVIGTSKAGCKDTLRFTASYFSPLNYSILSDKDEVASNSPLHLWSENIPYSHYLWDFGDGNVGEGVDLYHSFGVSEDKYFDVKLKVLNPNGCVEYATKRIWITIPNLPNIFNPNGGINDLFLKGWQIKLYNRNGILIYEGIDGWNGTYKDKVVTNGTYFYVLSYPTASGTKFQNGYVTVVR